jgi:hypothetical protein
MILEELTAFDAARAVCDAIQGTLTIRRPIEDDAAAYFRYRQWQRTNWTSKPEKGLLRADCALERFWQGVEQIHSLLEPDGSFYCAVSRKFFKKPRTILAALHAQHLIHLSKNQVIEAMRRRIAHE